MEGKELNGGASHRTFLDWLLVAAVTAIFVALAAMAQIPRLDIDLKWAALVSVAMFLLLVSCAIALWRTTRFS